MQGLLDGGGEVRRALASASYALVLVLLTLGVATPPAQASHGWNLHWDRMTPTPTAVAQVYFADHTGAAWPVGSQVAGAWAQTPNYLRVHYKTGGTCNNATLHCIPVVEINNPNMDPGWTTWDLNAATHHIVHDSMRVRLNNAYTYTAAFRREVVCHELGHAIGPMDHGVEDASCMKAWAPFVDTSTVHDRNTVRAVYDH